LRTFITCANVAGNGNSLAHTNHGINPNHYLTAVLKRIGNHQINRIDELLPWNIDLACVFRFVRPAVSVSSGHLIFSS